MPTTKEKSDEKQGHGSQSHSGGHQGGSHENRSHSGGRERENEGRSQSHGDTSQRGFASMDDEKQREIASKGGKAAHESGHAHEFDSEEAREAGRKGGEAVSQDKEHMSEIGRKGGEH
jgi:hypothetical protein